MSIQRERLEEIISHIGTYQPPEYIVNDTRTLQEFYTRYRELKAENLAYRRAIERDITLNIHQHNDKVDYDQNTKQG